MPILHNLYIRPVARIFPAEVSPISPVNLCPFPFHHPIPSPPFTVILAQVPLLQCIFSFFLPIILSLYSSYIEGPGNRFYLSSPAVVRAKISTYLCQISRKSVQGFLLQSETLKFSQWENRVNKTCQYFHGGGTAHPYGRVILVVKFATSVSRISMFADAMRLYDCKNVSNPAIEAKIKSWLRQATDRDWARRRHFLAAEKRHLLPSVPTDASDVSSQSSAIYCSWIRLCCNWIGFCTDVNS